MSTHCGICFGQGHTESSCDSRPRAVLRPVNRNDPAAGTTMWYERRIRELEAENENLKLAASCAQDVLDFWPTMTMRTIRVMIPKMETLKQALAMVKK